MKQAITSLLESIETGAKRGELNTLSAHQGIMLLSYINALEQLCDDLEKQFKNLTERYSDARRVCGLNCLGKIEGDKVEP